MRRIPVAQLEEAVRRGIISPSQLESIAALGDAHADADSAAGSPPRAFDAVSVSYHLGALLVAFAAAYFLIDRWAALRPGGVLLVALAYALALAVTAVVARRRGFALAEGVAATLVVILVPVIAWALANLAGIWAPYEVRFLIRPPGGAAWDSGRWLIPQLATIGAALIAARLVRFPLVLAPAAFATWTLAIPLTELLFGLELGGFLVGRMSLVVGTLLIACGYVVDRKVAERAWAFWLYLFGALATAVGLVHLASENPIALHLSPLIAMATIALALRIRRRLFLVVGGAGLVLYLAHLAFEVFAGTVLFPIALAGLGLAVILATIWFQRAYPRLTVAEEGESARLREVPGGAITMTVPVLLAVVLLVASIPQQRARLDAALRARQQVTEQMQEIEEQRTPPSRDPVAGETTSPPAP